LLTDARARQSRRLHLLSGRASDDGIEDRPLCLLNGRDSITDCETCVGFQLVSVALCKFDIYIMFLVGDVRL
jgi:hypothetical protein